MSQSIDRASIRAMVEDFWRSFLAVAKHNPNVGRESILRFEERIKATGALMQPEQASVFLQTIDEEREILFNEYQRDPEALKQRLGLAPSVTPALVIHHQQSLGEMVARTAVRATIWESIFAPAPAARRIRPLSRQLQFCRGPACNLAPVAPCSGRPAGWRGSKGGVRGISMRRRICPCAAGGTP
jgi:hypothetical protein